MSEAEISSEAEHRRYRPYPKYKDSDVEWLGKIPVNWDLKRLRLTVMCCQNGVWGNEPDGLNDIPCVRVADFDRVAFRVIMTEPTMRSIDERMVGMHTVRAGDLLLEKSGGGDKQPVGAVVMYDHNISAVCSNFIARMPVAEGFFPRFLTFFHAALYAARINTRSIKQNTGIQNLDSNNYLNEVVACPALREQIAIAAFLDRETAKIDGLIEKNERLIKLLQEKRTALITQAVTKGLDPTVPMKNSGIEWLGKIPAHWEVKRLRHIGAAIIGLTYEPADVVDPDDGVLVLRASNVCDGHIVLEDNVFVKRSIPAHLKTKVGDILICARSGSRALIGKNAMIDKTLAGLTFGAFMLVFRSVCNDYLFYAFNSTLFNYQSGAFLTSTINQLTLSNLNNFMVPAPPKNERSAIAAFLERETAKTDALVAKIHVAIDHLKEYRTALISAAVTGRIDLQDV